MGERRVVFVSTFPPRCCGLAEFTRDLRSAMAEVAPRWRVDVCAVDRDGLGYGPPVRVTVDQDAREDYERAARQIVRSSADVVVIEHEFGIFGGPAGRYVLDLVDGLRGAGVAYVVTLHTVRPHPPLPQAQVLAALCRDAAAVTVFTRDARRVAVETGHADPARIVVVPHGAPTVLRNPPDSPAGVSLAAVLPELADSNVLVSFGLVKPAKGFEHVIEALRLIRQRHRRVHYVIAGRTHPEVARLSGERYRQELMKLATDIGVERHVWFVDEFLTEAELSTLLRRADLCVTPYLSDEQASSGVLTFALAAGCPVVSTEYAYAKELLTPRAGTSPGALVPCGDTQALALAVNELLDNPARLAASRASALQIGAGLMWPQVAREFVEVLTLACGRSLHSPPDTGDTRPVRRSQHDQQAGASSA